MSLRHDSVNISERQVFGDVKVSDRLLAFLPVADSLGSEKRRPGWSLR